MNIIIDLPNLVLKPVTRLFLTLLFEVNGIMTISIRNLLVYYWITKTVFKKIQQHQRYKTNRSDVEQFIKFEELIIEKNYLAVNVLLVPLSFVDDVHIMQIEGYRFIFNTTTYLDSLLFEGRIADVSFSLYGFEFHPVSDNESMEIITGVLNYNRNNSSNSTNYHIQSSNEVIQTHIIPEKIYWESDSTIIFDLPKQMFINLSSGLWELRLLYGHSGYTPWVTIFNNTYSTTDTKNKKDTVLIISIIFSVIGLLAIFYLAIFLYFYCFKQKYINIQTSKETIQLEHSRSLIMAPYNSGDNLAKLVKEVKDDNNDDAFSNKNQINVQVKDESRSPLTPAYKNGNQNSRVSSLQSLITVKSPTMIPSASFKHLEKFIPPGS
ncbi:MAG: hypothetical protein EZS28_003574 [Streblomastix strix]|uniref:Uncharacterized protein n=1 Tax=Streblomastix strix TaxID=222440 RepID=A0A5J4X2C2_9EUKA|nr:MAG: hypothetical protein EZS28_003574 [Streblomastix strix]